MRPSRGTVNAWRISRNSLERRIPSPSLSSRNFSSFPTNRIIRPTPVSRIPRSSFLPISTYSAQARFNSSSSEPHHAHVPLNPLTSPADYSPEELHPEELLEDASRLLSSDVGEPWYTGYLNEQLGGFGWGPTSTIQWFLEHIQVYSGASVGATIIMTAIAIRLATFPLVIRASDTAAKLQTLKPQMDPIQARMKEAMAVKDQMTMAQCQRQMSMIRKSAGVKLRYMAFPLIQMPIGFGSWRLLRNMAFLPIPGMSTAGMFWFTNLCVPDPYYVLPVMIGFFQHMAFRLGGETGTASNVAASMRSVLMYGLPFMSLLVTMWAPAAIQLSFATSALLAITSNVLLKSHAFRRLIGLTALPKPTVKILDTSARVSQGFGAAQPPPASTPGEKVKNFMQGLSVKKAVARLQKTQTEVGDSMLDPANPLARFMPAKKGTPERKQADFRTALEAREKQRAAQAQKQSEMDFQQSRAKRAKRNQ